MYRFKSKAWKIGVLIVDRDLFYAIEIAIDDRHLVKRLQDDRDRDLFCFFQQSTFCRSNISNMPEPKEWKIRKKIFWLH